MLYFLIFATLASSVTAAGALIVASYLYGENKINVRIIVEVKRTERRHLRELRTLHSKFSEKAGFGSLKPRLYKEPSSPQSPPRRVVSPNEVIANMKMPQAVPTLVPDGIKDKFLVDAGISAS